MGFHGGVGLAQIYCYPQRSLAVHHPGGHSQDTLFHVSSWSQAAELLERHHGILEKNIAQKTLALVTCMKTAGQFHIKDKCENRAEMITQHYQ